MKKFTCSLICLNLLSTNLLFANELVSDNLVDLLDKNLKIEKPKHNLINDDFIDSSLDKNLKINSINNKTITDDFASNTLNKNLKIKKQDYIPVVDETINLIDKNKIKTVKTTINTEIYDYKAKVYPISYHTTKRNLKEGDVVDFALAEDLKIKNTIYKKGTRIKARVENISKNGAFGVPADLTIGNFNIGNITLNGDLTIKGANRTLWLYPTSYILMPIFFAGALLYPIRGGHAKLKPSKTYEIEI